MLNFVMYTGKDEKKTLKSVLFDKLMTADMKKGGVIFFMDNFFASISMFEKLYTDYMCYAVGIWRQRGKLDSTKQKTTTQTPFNDIPPTNAVIVFLNTNTKCNRKINLFIGQTPTRLVSSCISRAVSRGDRPRTSR